MSKYERLDPQIEPSHTEFRDQFRQLCEAHGARAVCMLLEDTSPEGDSNILAFGDEALMERFAIQHTSAEGEVEQTPINAFKDDTGVRH